MLPGEYNRPGGKSIPCSARCRCAPYVNLLSEVYAIRRRCCDDKVSRIGHASFSLLFAETKRGAAQLLKSGPQDFTQALSPKDLKEQNEESLCYVRCS